MMGAKRFFRLFENSLIPDPIVLMIFPEGTTFQFQPLYKVTIRARINGGYLEKIIVSDKNETVARAHFESFTKDQVNEFILNNLKQTA